MTGIAAFHIVMLLLGIGVATRSVSAERVATTLSYLHKSIGITTPSAQQSRMVALIWIGSVIVIVDGCVFLLLFITSMSNSR
jgi:hypothetical protein